MGKIGIPKKSDKVHVTMADGKLTIIMDLEEPKASISGT